MKVDYNIIKKYLESRDTNSERSRIISWFNNFQAEKDLREKSRIFWDRIPKDVIPDNYDDSRVLGNIYREIKITENQRKPKTKPLIRVVNFLGKVAAILFIPLVILYVSNIHYGDTQSGEIAYTEIYSPLGARTMFYLPDGSHGWLNGGSYLKFPERFQGKTREVSLKGEAFFDVVTNPKKSFIVSGKYLGILVRGTSFNVRAWEDNAETEIVMVEGNAEVYFNAKDESKKISILSPGQLLHCAEGNSESYIKDVDVEKYISWTKGRLVFRDDPFSEVVKRLNRWYNVNIIIKDEILKSYEYVATFEDETLDEILKMLTLSAPIRYREVKRTQSKDGTFRKRTIELYYKPAQK